MSTPSLIRTVVSTLVNAPSAAGWGAAMLDAVASAARRPRSTGAQRSFTLRSARGSAAGRRVRLGCGRPDRSARVSRHAPTRGFRLSRRPRAAAVRAPLARRGPPVCTGDRRVPRGAGGEARRRRLQHGDVCGAAPVAGGARRAGRRRDHAGGTRGRPGDAERPCRVARDGGDRRSRPVCAARACARRGRRARRGRLSAARPADRERRSVRLCDDRCCPRVRRAAEGGGRRHGHPRVYALSADPSDLPARVRARCDARLLGGRNGARSCGDARAQAIRKRRRAGGDVPFPHHRPDGCVPRDGCTLPSAPDRRRRARRAVAARSGGCVTRTDGRRFDQLRALELTPDYLEQPHGSVLLAQGMTKVLCTASVQEGVPRWLYGKGRGWLTAEYSLLPASTGDRTEREASRGKQGGRTVEIQRLIGRSIRAVTDFEALGERTLWVDCDVLQADGGTRCAAISGAYVAARRALDRFGLSKALTGAIAAVSVGIVDGEPLLDLDYSEDSTAEVDMNVVMTGDAALVEVQATAERTPFTRTSLDELLELAAGGIEQLVAAQDEAVAAARI